MRTLRATIAAVLVIGAFGFLGHAVANAQTSSAARQAWNPPLTADGQPDIGGFWEVVNTGTLPQMPIYSLEGLVDDRHHVVTGGRTARTYRSMIVDPPDGRIPYQPWAAARRKEYLDNHTNPSRFEYMDGRSRCFLPGMPRQSWDSGGTQIIQTPGSIVMLIEFTHAYRVIPLGSRPHLAERIQLWQGDSRGHWEGNTLVVDVTNSNGKPRLDVVGDFHSDAVHVVERWTLVDVNTIEYEVTLEDPQVYTRPWKMAFTFKRQNEPGYELLEHACYEGNRAPQLMIEGAKATSR